MNFKAPKEGDAHKRQKIELLPTGVIVNEGKDHGFEDEKEEQQPLAQETEIDEAISDNGKKIAISMFKNGSKELAENLKISELQGKIEKSFADFCEEVSNFFKPHILENAEPSVYAAKFLNEKFVSFEATLSHKYKDDITKFLLQNESFIDALVNYYSGEIKDNDLSEIRAVEIANAEIVLGSLTVEFKLFLDLLSKNLRISRTGINPFSKSALILDPESPLWRLQRKLLG